MSVVRIIYLGTPDFAVAPLEALAKDSHFEIVRVFTQPDRPAGRNLNLRPSPVKEKALELGLSVASVEDINAPEVLEQIRQLNVESAVVVAFGQILKTPFLELFVHPAVNVHSSLLPRWRGAAPMQRAILEGDAETGVALQVMALKLDAGPVLGVRKVALTDDIDITRLYDILKQKACELLQIEFMDYVRGYLQGLEQNPSLVTVARKIKKEEGEIIWSEGARQVFNRIRALKGWPGTWTYRDGKPLKVVNAVLVEGVAVPSGSLPGMVLAAGADGIDVVCGATEGGTRELLRVTEVQPESRAAMKVADYLRGYPLKQGDIFGRPTI